MHVSTAPPRRASGCLGCLQRLLLATALAVTLVVLASQARGAERDRRAPVVVAFAADASGCSLSPGGRHLRLQGEGLGWGDFFDTATGERVTIPLPPELHGPSSGLWLRGEIYFRASDYEPASGPGLPTGYELPRNGWLIDVSSRLVTDTLSLNPLVRQAIYDQAATRAAFPAGFPSSSPDGNYVYSGGLGSSVIYADDGWPRAPRRLNELPRRLTGGGWGCNEGWSPDSRGHYIIDAVRPLGSLTAPGSGPVRLLLADPPPSLAPELWWGLTWAVGLGAAGRWLWSAWSRQG